MSASSLFLSAEINPGRLITIVGRELDILFPGYYNRARDPWVADLTIVLDWRGGWESRWGSCPSRHRIISRRMFMTIKRLLIISGVLFVILVGLGIYTLAILIPQTQASQASATPQTSATLTPAVTATTTRTAKGRKFVGTIQSLGNQTFVIVLSRGRKTVTVNVDAS